MSELNILLKFNKILINLGLNLLLEGKSLIND